MRNSWDVIVVGARCSGATLSSVLARNGARVLLLEAAPRGTDMPMSTHLVQSPGMDVLDRLGVGDRVRGVAPATRRLRVALDDQEILTTIPEGRAAYCVRRSTLDPWLQDAAEAAGAELRDRHRVVDLVRDAERVRGVVVETPSGRETLHADLVVGADGPHSTVARRAEVEEYLAEESTRGGYWAYFSAPSEWNEPWDATIEHRGSDLRYVFRSEGDQVLLVSATDRETTESWGKDHRARLLAHLALSPLTRRLSEGQEPIGKDRGLLKTRFFYRRPIGPGFALVGDAGHFKDFVTGQGMTDALLDAERLARAVLDGRQAAFVQYWRERDVATLPLHFDAIRQGKIGYNSPFMRWIFRCIARRPDLAARAGLVADRRLDPGEMLAGADLARFVGSALLHGRFDVLPGFFATGREQQSEHRELALRRKLLDEARAAVSESGARNAARPPPGDHRTVDHTPAMRSTGTYPDAPPVR